jgi:hypothetical protein
MAWNHMQIEITPDDRLIRPMIGPGGLTRDQAHAEVAQILARAAEQTPAVAKLAATWKRGAQDDTVFLGLYAWTIYEHQDDDPTSAALAWLDDYAQTMRQAGLDVQVARL